MKIFFNIILQLSILSSSLHAAEVDVRYDKKTYYLSAEFQVKASPARVMQVLTNFKDIAGLNPAIIESELLESPGDEILRVRSVVKDCVIFFCRKITRVEDVQRQGNEKLETFIIAEQSDLRSGYSVWVLSENRMGTNVMYTANMQPKFWVPPMIHTQVLTKKFQQRVAESVQLIQTKATSIK